MRFSGIASGIDTESIIRDMMQINRMPLTKVTQKKQTVQWQLDNYRSINRSLNTFRNNTFNNMIMSDSFTKKTMDISNPGALGVRNLNSTSDFSGSIKVGQLATNSTMQGTKIEATVTGEDGTTTKETAKSTSTMEELGLSAGTDGKITISTIGADGTRTEKDVEFKSTDTLKSVLDKINKDTDVTAFFDSQTGRIGMSSNHGGKLEDGKDGIVVSGDLASELGLTVNITTDPGTGDEVRTGATVTSGQNAIFEFNGMQMERSSNKFEINGFEFTLKEKTADIDETTGKITGGTAITFASAADTDSIVDSVVKFVDEYNKLIESLNDKIREPKYRDFHPLSTEEKAEMKEKEIELWEEKAMSGTLRNDPIISSMLSEMRTALMGTVGGKNSDSGLKSIGITTSSNYLDNGKLVIDEKALREAINEDPNKVHQLFAADSTTPANPDDPNQSKKTQREEMGFARRLQEIVRETETKITKHAGSANTTNDNFTLGKSLIDMDKQIVRFEDRLKMTEDRLWRQFTAMEVAIQKANAQSASLMSSLGGGM